jgi:predicted alpha-1,6-mannanase (GH76 family)
MEVAVPIDEEEALRNIQSQNETVYDSVTTDVQVIESDETVIAEDGGVAGNNNRGDEGLLEGVAVGNIDAYCSDSDDDEEEVRIILKLCICR